MSEQAATNLTRLTGTGAQSLDSSRHVTLATFMEVLDTSVANVALLTSPRFAAGQDEAAGSDLLSGSNLCSAVSGWLSSIFEKTLYMSLSCCSLRLLLCGIPPAFRYSSSSRFTERGRWRLAAQRTSILADTSRPQRHAWLPIYGMHFVLPLGPTIGGGWITTTIAAMDFSIGRQLFPDAGFLLWFRLTSESITAYVPYWALVHTDRNPLAL